MKRDSHKVVVAAALQCLSAIVDPIVQTNHIAMVLQYSDKRDKVAPLQPILVQIVGTAVARGDHHDALVEQVREQPLQDHRIGNVGDLELVETDQPTVLDDLVGHWSCGIEGIGLVVTAVHLLLALLLVVDLLVHLRHERVEVDTALAIDLEERGRD